MRRYGGFLIRIEEGAMWPAWYGFAWRDYATMHAWCAPVPFNILIGVLRRLYFLVKCGVPMQALDKSQMLVEHYSRKCNKLVTEISKLRHERARKAA